MGIMTFLLGIGIWALSASSLATGLTCQTAQNFQAIRDHGVAAANTRPESIGFIDSTTIPIRVHYQEGVELSYVEEMRAAAEASWQVLFEEIGFPPPHPDGELGGNDRFDFYVVTDLMEGVGGYTGFSGYYEESDRIDAFGYIVLAHNVDSRLRRGVVAHELSHASQIAQDFWEHLSFMEGTAVWVTNRVFPDENMAWRYFTFFQDEPYTALNYTSITAPFQYGTGMWVTYLEEKFGDGTGTFLQQVWNDLSQNEYNNEPDYLDSISSQLQHRGIDFASSFREFGAWRTFVGSRDDGEHFRNSHLWTGWRKSVEPYFVVEASQSTSYTEGASLNGLQQLSHGLISLKRPGLTAETVSLAIQFAELGYYHLDVYAREGQGPWQKLSEQHLSPADEAQFQLVFDTSAETTELVGVVTAFGAEPFDPDTVTWKNHDFSYQVRMQPQPSQ